MAAFSHFATTSSQWDIFRIRRLAGVAEQVPEWRECAKAALGYDSLCVKFSKLVMDEGAAGRFKSITRATPDTLKRDALLLTGSARLTSGEALTPRGVDGRSAARPGSAAR